MTELHPNQAFILKSGEIAKDFSLPNTDGRIFTLSAVLEKGPVVVLFYRGDW